MSSQKTDLLSPIELSEQQVAQWLSQNPDFLLKHPDLLEVLTPPTDKQEGEAIADFQYHMVQKLQTRQHRLRSSYDELVKVSRDNVSAQAQVHRAVIALIKAETLDGLLQTLTQDLMALFDVDVIRLAIETPLAEHFETSFGQENYSGLCAIYPHSVDALLGQKQLSLAVADTRESFPEGAREIFESCSGLIRSFVMIRLQLPHSKRPAILAFGVRHAGRFQAGQGDELLQFLGQIVSLRLEPCLKREGLDEF